MSQQVAYFEILEPRIFSNAIIEARCGDCAGVIAAKLVIGPGPYWDGYMQGIDYAVINARTREEVPKDRVIVIDDSASCGGWHGRIELTGCGNYEQR